MMRRMIAALGVATVLCLGAVTPALAADDVDGPADISVTIPQTDGSSAILDAQLLWGLNAESGAGAYAGECNFLSAGVAGNTGSSRAWTAADGFYRAQDGAVTIVRPNAAREWETARWETRCATADGTPVTGEETTGAQVSIVGGTGRVYADGRLEIGWTGSFTIAYYGGMTYWTVNDPVLALDASGNGQLIGTASGYGASREDASRWYALPRQSIVLAEIRGADMSGGGFAVVPEYLGVAVSGAGQVPKTAANAAYWGSFPASFVAYQSMTGQLGYWLTTGGAHDAAKPATTLYVNYDAGIPVVTPPAGGGAATDGGATPSNPVVQRPAVAAPVAAPVAPATTQPMIQAVNALSFLPGVKSLVPEAGSSIPAFLPPLAVAVLALLIATLAAFSLARLLPWQRRVTDAAA